MQTVIDQISLHPALWCIGCIIFLVLEIAFVSNWKARVLAERKRQADFHDTIDNPGRKL